VSSITIIVSPFQTHLLNSLGLFFSYSEMHLEAVIASWTMPEISVRMVITPESFMAGNVEYVATVNH
jgi:hypothetical protein